MVNFPKQFSFHERSFSVTGRCVKWAAETISPLLEGIEVLTWGFDEVEFFVLLI